MMFVLFIVLVLASIGLMATSNSLYNAGMGAASMVPFQLSVLFAVAAYFVFGVL